MKVVTYLGFTVLSIFIQFCVMDFIQEKIQIKENAVEANMTFQKKTVDNLLKNISGKPHALYYRTHLSKSIKRAPVAVSGLSEDIYSNSSVSEVPLGTTDISTTIFDILYDENSSATETVPTTEAFLTTTEFDNVTEITFFENRNKSTNIPNTLPKISFNKYCGCNLLYKICDIGCCCDQDCTDQDKKHFQCEKKNNLNIAYSNGCISLLDSEEQYGSTLFNNIFCVVKSNLPDRRSMKKPILPLAVQYHKWTQAEQSQNLYKFKKTLYTQEDPIWLLQNGNIYNLDFPVPMINNFCTDRTPIKFLKNEKIQCMVKFNDLEMFHISKSADAMVISATDNTVNSTVLNCSNLHCSNWTILACHNGICTNYIKSLNEVSCTESACINVALNIDYHFYYYNSKIVNATIKLHFEKISSYLLPFMSQEITVNFIMANRSLDHVIEFSGNPGYINNLPVIISKSTNNYSNNFFNNTSMTNYLIFPENHNGVCVSNTSQNVVRFGLNKRMKCRYVHAHTGLTQNYTEVCKSIQDSINNSLGLNKVVSVSAFGNPYGIKDENWIKLQTEFHTQQPVYGEYSQDLSKLYCYNLISRVSIIFLFAKVDEKEFTSQNKILLARYEVVSNNASFNMEDISMVLTVDINFVDASRPHLYVYAGSPNLNIHLPKDFFFPFPTNNYSYMFKSCIVTIFCCVIMLYFSK